MKTELGKQIDMSSSNTGKLLREARQLDEAGVNPIFIIKLYGRAKQHGTTLNSELSSELFTRIKLSKSTGQPYSQK